MQKLRFSFMKCPHCQQKNDLTAAALSRHMKHYCKKRPRDPETGTGESVPVDTGPIEAVPADDDGDAAVGSADETMDTADYSDTAPIGGPGCIPAVPRAWCVWRARAITFSSVFTA